MIEARRDELGRSLQVFLKRLNELRTIPAALSTERLRRHAMEVEEWLMKEIGHADAEAYSRLVHEAEDPVEECIDFLVTLKEHLGSNPERYANRPSQIDSSGASPLPAATMPARVDHVVGLIHGIRTQAAWAEMVKDVMEESAGVKCSPLKYDYFDVFRFLCPLWTRQAPITRIRKKITALQAGHPGAALSIVAHSFGTYIVCRLLFAEPHLRLRRLLLCGSVVPTTYEWDRVGSQIESDVLNDCGSKDIWPILAAAVTWGYGPSGTFGFGDPKVHDRYHPIGHSEFFDRAFVADYWTPYITAGALIKTKWEVNRPTPPAWQSFLALGWLRWALVAATLMLIAGYCVRPLPVQLFRW